MVTVVGTVALPLLLVSVTVTPPGPAGEARVTIPSEGVPPVTGFGDKTIPLITPCAGPEPGLIVSGAVTVLLEAAEMLAVI